MIRIFHQDAYWVWVNPLCIAQVWASDAMVYNAKIEAWVKDTTKKDTHIELTTGAQLIWCGEDRADDIAKAINIRLKSGDPPR